MKKYIFIFICLLSLMFVSGCRNDYKVSEKFTDKKYELNDFNDITIKDIYLKQTYTYFGPNVYFIGGDSKSITIHASVDLIDEISVKQFSDEVEIFASKFKNYITEKVEITIAGYKFEDIEISNSVVDIKKEALAGSNVNINVSGASKTTIEKVNCDNLDLDINGASKMEIDYLDVNEFNADVSGASYLDIKATIAKEIDLDVSGASKAVFNNTIINSADFNISGASNFEATGVIKNIEIVISGATGADLLKAVVDDAKADVSGASNLKINFINSLRVNLSGASDLKYKTTNGKLEVNKSTSCEVEQAK